MKGLDDASVAGRERVEPIETGLNRGKVFVKQLDRAAKAKRRACCALP